MWSVVRTKSGFVSKLWWYNYMYIYINIYIYIYIYVCVCVCVCVWALKQFNVVVQHIHKTRSAKSLKLYKSIYIFRIIIIFPVILRWTHVSQLVSCTMRRYTVFYVLLSWKRLWDVLELMALYKLLGTYLFLIRSNNCVHPITTLNVNDI